MTQHTIATSSLANLQANLGRVSQLQEQMTSGKVINRPSDSPTGTISALDLKAQIKATEQYSRNADDAVSWLGAQDTTLGSINDVLQRVRSLTLTGISTGNSDVDARKAIATEIASLRDSVLGMANTTYLGRPIFGGTTSGSQAFAVDTSDPSATPSPVTYVGDGGQVDRRVNANATVRVDSSGTAVFGPDGASLFTVLDRIAKNVLDDPAALQADLGALDTATMAVRTARTDVGSRYGQAEAARQTADDRVLTLRATLSGVEDIDLPHTIMDLQMQQMAYQTALGATAKALQPSLLDFLR
ncbi:MAG TPA: flagellar hook-associated protein FlgL [Actinomycetales bacterium]|nr:flagellar hook-associated protein FlgL [Actinomycetales bacterium]